MFCNQCGQLLDPDSRFCSACGIEVRKEIFARRVYRNVDVNLLLGYIGWLVLVSLSFVLIPRFLLPDLDVENRMSAFITIANINFIIAIVDIVLIVLVIGLSKAKIIKIAFAVYLICKIILLLLNIKM